MAMRKVPRLWPSIQVPKVRVFGTVEVSVMGKVMVSFKIFPTDIESDMSQLQDKIRKSLEGSASVYKFEEEPVAFGLVALVAHIIMPEDVEGRMDEVESRLKSLEGISEVQVLVSRRV